jgi:hypothetical protein
VSALEWFRGLPRPAARDLVTEIAGQTKKLHQVFVRPSFCSSCYRCRTIARGRKVARRASPEVKCIGESKAR